MTERYLFLMLALMGAAAVYVDQDLLNTWIGPAMVGAPFLAWLIAIAAQRSRRKGDVGEKKEEAKGAVEEKEAKETGGKEVGREAKGAPTPTITVEDIEEHANDYRKEGALWLLSVFQREGRLVDFIQEDISPYDDAQIGAACREIHQGLRQAIKDVLKFSPVVDAQEGTEIEVDEDYDPRSIRLTGNLVGKPPYKGVLIHPGWKVEELRLPQFAENVRHDVITQAEIEVG